jgi:hypothetical protein
LGYYRSPPEDRTRIGAVMIEKLAPPPEMMPEKLPGQDEVRLTLPSYLIDELSWVAKCEQVEISRIIQDAVDQYLADHWIRNQP